MPRLDEPMLLAGTLDLLVLRALAWGPRHGYAVARWIHETSKEAIEVEDRALYLSLHRLEDRGFVESEWAYSENNRRAKFYELTAAGRRQLKTQERAFGRYVEAVFLILGAEEEPAKS
jgi:PadR family transcriptional regulator PadR